MAQGHKTCPSCHTAIMPMKIRDDITIKLNWQDLRVLAIYAKRWTTFFDLTKKDDQDCMKAFNRLIEKLLMYQPPNSLPLTIENEVVEVKLPKGNDRRLLDRQDGKIDLTPDKDGNIPSPFYFRGLPPLQ